MLTYRKNTGYEVRKYRLIIQHYHSNPRPIPPFPKNIFGALFSTTPYGVKPQSNNHYKIRSPMPFYAHFFKLYQVIVLNEY